MTKSAIAQKVVGVMKAIILAHGGAAETVARHTSNWEDAFDQIITITPSDDPLPGSLPIGMSCRNGQGAIERLLFAIVMASRFPKCAILEYDCLVFPKREQCGVIMERNKSPHPLFRKVFPIDDRSITCSEVFPNQDPEHIFAGKAYGHAPWIATGETWWHILQAGSDLQHGFPDRWLANAAQRAKVPLIGMPGAYSRDVGFDAEAARTAREKGAPCIHGVKTEADYRVIMDECHDCGKTQEECQCGRYERGME